jgi:hypothetical protein
MPCNDSRDDYGVTVPDKEYNDLKDTEAMLCGITKVLESHRDQCIIGVENNGGENILDNVLNDVDWKEVGTSKKKFYAWWTKHKAADAAKKADKELICDKANRVKAALKKLTPEERKLLGINDR